MSTPASQKVCSIKLDIDSPIRLNESTTDYDKRNQEFVDTILPQLLLDIEELANRRIIELTGLNMYSADLDLRN